MAEDKTRLRLKLGAAEIDFEGSEAFLKAEVLPNVVERMLEMVQERADLQRPPVPIVQISDQKAPSLATSQTNTPLGQRSDLSTTTIATLSGAQTASDLAIAAAARLVLVNGAASATREEIAAEMKGATAFFKASMINNLSNTLKRLVKEDRLRLVGTDTYSLALKERQALEQKLEESE